MKVFEKAESLLSSQNFDSLAVGMVDYKSGDFDSKCFSPYKKPLYFDLASLTKPLTLGVIQCLEKLTVEEELLRDHRGGLPSWARLTKDWKEYLDKFSVQESKVEYSDLGALKLQRELEKRGISLYEKCSPYWKDLTHWTDLDVQSCAPTGFRQGVICGTVNDDNAFIIGEKLSHAGLFSTVSGVCKTLLFLKEKLQWPFCLLENSPQERFYKGLDTSIDGLAGSKNLVFGHLGFTGTSFWIDPNNEKAFVLLTNGTQNYWHDRKGLNALRKELGALFWK